MILGLSYLTWVHVIISLVAIGTGFVAMWGLLSNQRLPGWTAIFLATTVATSVTGFIFFPFEKFLPSHLFGILSLIALASAVVAFYQKQLIGDWRKTYVISALISQYLNVFVLVAQSFLKIPFLKALAPTQSEPPFLIAQLVVLVAFAYVGYLAVARFRGEVDRREVN
ncbi:MAG TPA: hypothetical protein VL096_12210 [Pirellulaceae bacterium]|nr:hypothetical protein [Pirellulaceae bacterium]